MGLREKGVKAVARVAVRANEAANFMLCIGVTYLSGMDKSEYCAIVIENDDDSRCDDEYLDSDSLRLLFVMLVKKNTGSCVTQRDSSR